MYVIPHETAEMILADLISRAPRSGGLAYDDTDTSFLTILDVMLEHLNEIPAREVAFLAYVVLDGLTSPRWHVPRYGAWHKPARWIGESLDASFWG